MTLARISRFGIPIITFVLGVCLGSSGPRLLGKVFPPKYRGRQEQRRVTSPNGHFDAVEVFDDYGGSLDGDFDRNVYIVRKGKPVPPRTQLPLFSASQLDHEALVWRLPHLLEIQYDAGVIRNFQNLWCLGVGEHPSD